MKKVRILFVLLLALSAFIAAFSVIKPVRVKVYSIDDLVKRVSPKDTTYVINFWATWCKPCVAELPEFEKLNADSAGTKIKVLLVSLDFKEDIKTRLLPFLKKNFYKTEVVLLDESDATSFIPKLDERWSGAIPATLVKRGDKRVFAEKKLKLENLLEMIRESGKD